MMKNILVPSLILCLFGSWVFAEDVTPELEVRELEENVYLHTSYERYEGFGLVASNGLVTVDGIDAYIIDTPVSTKDTKALVEWILAQGLKVTASVSTHFHEDSTAGIEWLDSQSIPTYASSRTNELLDRDRQVQARYSFDETSFWLVEDRIEVFYPGAGHTEDNVVVWLPEHGILFGGCFVKIRSLGNLSDAVLQSWPASAQNLVSRYGDAKMVVPGHGEVGDASLLTRTRLLALVGIATDSPLQQIGKAGNN